MNIATVLAITFFIIGLLIAFNGAWLLFSSLFPKFIRQSQTICAKPLKPFLVGIGIGFIPFLFSLQFVGNALTGVLGWPLLFSTLILALAGTATIAQRIGNGMPSQNDRQDPWRRNLRGGMVLSFSYLLPVVGWLWIPVSLTFGSGIAFLAALQVWKEHKASKLEEEEEEEEEEDSPEDLDSEATPSRIQEEVAS